MNTLRAPTWPTIALLASLTPQAPGRTGDSAETVRITVAWDGTDPHGNGLASSRRGFSEDNRWVVFTSAADNMLPPGVDTNRAQDVFVRDMLNGEVVRMSESEPGVGIAGNCSTPSISNNGRFVVFEATGGSYGHLGQVLCHDRDWDNGADPPNGIYDERSSGATKTFVVSVDSSGQPRTGGDFPDISSTGRFVAFISLEPVVGETDNGVLDVYVHDRDWDNGASPPNGVFDEPGAVRTVLVSEMTGGAPACAHCAFPSISDDGRFVSFYTECGMLDGRNPCGPRVDTNGFFDVYVRDRDTDCDGVFDEPDGVATFLASAGSDGQIGNGDSVNGFVSGDGTWIAFQSDASNLDAGDTNGAIDIFVHGLACGVTRRVSLSSAGDESSQPALTPTLSRDGRFVAFLSDATNLVLPDMANFLEVFVHDRDADEDGDFDEPRASTTTRVVLDAGCDEGIGDCDGTPSISPDGSLIAFSTVACNLAPGGCGAPDACPSQGDCNGLRDVYVRFRGRCVVPSITANPSSVEGCLGQTITLTAQALGDPPLAFQWRKGLAPIPGATGTTLVMGQVQPGDTGSYDVVVTNGCVCGEAWSAPAIVSIDPCPADLTGDGQINGADLGFLLGTWGVCLISIDCPPDLTCDGVVDGADLGLMLGMWGPCP